MSEDGTHGGFLEYTLEDVLDKTLDSITESARSAVAAIISGQFIGVAYKIASITGDTQAARAFAAQAKLDLIEVVGNFPENSGISQEIFGLTLVGVVNLFAGVDPPVPTVLADSNSQLGLPSNFATADVNFTANGTAGVVTGAVQTEHAQFTGPLNSSWTTDTTSSFAVNSLDIPSDATVFSADGTAIGAGVVSLVATAPASRCGRRRELPGEWNGNPFRLPGSDIGAGR